MSADPITRVDGTAGAEPGDDLDLDLDDTFAADEPGDAGAGAPQTPIEQVRAQAAAELAGEGELLPEIELPIGARPGWSLMADPNLDIRTLQMWQKRCEDPQLHDGLDLVKLSCVVLANQTRDVRRHGSSSGWTFRDRELWRILRASSGWHAVLQMFGGRKRSATVVAAAAELLGVTGLDEVLRGEDVTDPTGAS